MECVQHVYATGTAICVSTQVQDVYVFDGGAIVAVRENRAVVYCIHGVNPAFYAFHVAKILGHDLEWRGGFWDESGVTQIEETA